MDKQLLEEHYALVKYVKENNVDEVKTMLLNGVNPDSSTGHEVALHYINSVEMLDLFIDHISNFYLMNDDGETLFHKAIINNNIDVVKALLEKVEVNPYYIDSKDREIISYAKSDEMASMIQAHKNLLKSYKHNHSYYLTYMDISNKYF